jgi:hypothetical protein
VPAAVVRNMHARIRRWRAASARCAQFGAQAVMCAVFRVASVRSCAPAIAGSPVERRASTAGRRAGQGGRVRSGWKHGG